MCVCFLASIIWRAKCTCVLSAVACLALLYFSTLSHKWHMSVTHVLWFSLHFSFWSISHFKKNSEKLSKIYIDVHIKCLLFLSDFNQTWISSTDFQKFWISNFMKILPVGAELFCVDGHSDVMKLIVTFCNFAKLIGTSVWKVLNSCCSDKG